MDINVKNLIDNYRSEGLSFRKIVNKLKEDNIFLSASYVQHYSFSRVQTVEFTHKQKYSTLEDNKDAIIHIIKSSENIKNAYIKIADVGNCYSVDYSTFVNWIHDIGDFKIIKSDNYIQEKTKTNAHFMSKGSALLFENNRELVLNNIDKTYQKICDLIQDKSTVITTPGEICKWCKLNGIKKQKAKKKGL